MNRRPRFARPCAICQKVRVEKTKVCEGCQKKYEGQEDEPWYKFAIEESDRTTNLIHNQRRREVSLDVIQYTNESN